MAKLSALLVNAKAIADGEWHSPGEEFDDLQFKVRGMTDKYRDSLARKLRKAAQGFGGDTSRIPSDIFRSLLCDAINEHILLDVRGLEDEDGKAITIEQLRKMLPSIEATDLRDGVIRCATQVGRVKAEDLAEAGESSARPSA